MSITPSGSAISNTDSPHGPHRDRRLRLLSDNIQTGITYHHYGHYLTRRWQHVIPNRARRRNLDHIAGHHGTFSSWRPRRRIDHILVTPEIRVQRSFVPGWRYSDHLPIAMDVILPEKT